MKFWFLGAAVAASLTAPALATMTKNTVTGDYVEARSASVYAGACHYNGELTTAGREAVMAWNVHEGVVEGVRVDGLGVVAVVAGADNLADAKAARRSVIYVDARATPAQREALAKWLRATANVALGAVAAVKSAPMHFRSDADSVTVAAGNAAHLSVSKYPCQHCRMPAQTWYAPLTSIPNAVVAQGVASGYKDPTLGISWSQETSDNVFLGTFGP